jgi:hypothetical protein
MIRCLHGFLGHWLAAVSRLAGSLWLKSNEQTFHEKSHVFALICCLRLEISMTELNLQSLSEIGFQADLGLSKSKIVNPRS